MEFPYQNDSYLCYVPTYTPNLKLSNNGIGNTFTVQLLPPIPSEGTIFTAFSQNGYFSLRIENSQLIYKYNNLSTLIKRNLNDVFPPIILEIRNRSQAYQIDLTVHKLVSDLSLRSLSNGSVQSGREVASGMTQGLIYSTVCVGGSLLEVHNYNGLMRRALFNYNSLLEERNACLLQSRRQTRSDFISFNGALNKWSFALERVNLRASRMSFQFKRTGTGDTIFWVLNDNESIFLSSVSLFTVFSATVGGVHTFADYDALDGDEWHQVDIHTSFSGNGQDSISIAIDGQTVIPEILATDPRELSTGRLNLSEVIDSPIHFGSQSFSGSSFTGCMREFIFHETPSSEILRLNLDVLPLLNSTEFSIDRSCFSCNGGISCPDNQMCSDPGYNESMRCVDSAIPDNSIGMNCIGELKD